MAARSETQWVKDVEREVEVAAPVDTVWQALTDAHELTRWFPTEARVVPGLGGSITMQWRGEPPLHSRIEIWMPHHHLRLVGLGGLDDLVSDIFLEGRDGSTILRVVTSGFGTDPSWDNIMEGFQTGCDFELLGLKHYLERHQGSDRLVARARVDISDCEATWNQLVHSGAWFSPDLQPGERFSIGAGPTAINGVVRVWKPPRQMVGAVEGWNDALARVTLFCPDQMSGRITAWLSAYDVPASEVHALEQAWQASLIRLLQH
jgi:hypothetical protein